MGNINGGRKMNKKRIIILSSAVALIVAVVIVVSLLVSFSGRMTVYYYGINNDNIYVSDTNDFTYEDTLAYFEDSLTNTNTHVYVLHVKNDDNTVFDADNLDMNNLPEIKTKIILYKVKQTQETIYPQSITCKTFKIN